ncbi:entericidin A/B family lipoprotein [Legionella maioricensis]|uniref:Entericidin A/B family lipoprotein n=1 Tax=Legionella maioricensis TaxID=2896528 RepID=A0A9X2IDR6_9GAMM|nr:entericidin A/B family lipoprotein [Legionella maioricensis]MCL9685058.1 entericidin A/B family lipoprotein [Legionella maioricensis]MCL9688181.1 entericidin A/B family lipoprotein [Legionella maioricensis]
MKNNKKIAMVCFFLTTLFILNGCGTVRGFGKDVSKTGQVIQKAAR